MANAQLVTAADVEPHGWRADACRHEFKAGDIAIALTSGHEYGSDPYGLDPAGFDYDMTTGYRASDWICLPCFMARGEQDDATQQAA